MRAAVTAGAHDHRYKGDQNRNRDKGCFVFLDNTAGDGGRQHQKEEPEESVFGMGKDRGLQIAVLTRDNGGHLGDILGVFFLQDINCVIDRDNADQTVFAVNNRHGQKVVTVKDMRNILLIVNRADVGDVGFHDFFDHL